MNQTILIGRLTSDPTLKSIPSSGMAVCNFNLAVDKELAKDKKAEFESKGKPTADFIPIVVFGKTAESCANFLAKGRKTAVIGSIQTSTYTNKEGNKVYKTEVLASKVEFLEWGDKADKPKAEPTADAFSNFADDDIFQSTDKKAPWEE